MTLTVQMRSFFLINQMSSTSKLSLLLCFDDFFLSSKTTNFRHVLPQDQISKKKICFCYFVRKTESVTEMTFSGTNLLFLQHAVLQDLLLESLRQLHKKIVENDFEAQVFYFVFEFFLKKCLVCLA